MNPVVSPSSAKEFELIEVCQEQDEFVFKLSIPEKLIYFQGHFEDFPVLPGVCQIKWADQLSSEYLQIPATAFCKDVLKLKFMSPIKPQQNISLKLKQQGAKVRFSFESPNQKYSSGVLVYDER